MGSNSSKFSLEQSIGNVNLPRILNPTIRGSIRRTSPDGGHSLPYFLGLTSKTLILSVTPVIGDITITFTSDLISDAITAINLVSPSNLKASDEDGYLRITNINTGNKNSLKIVGGTSVTILGFVISPEPGSISFAGELATSSPGRSQTAIQNNPQGTHLIAQDEDLTSSVINRGIAGSVEHIERLLRDLDREIPIVRRISVTTITLPTTGERCFVITDPTIRFPVDGFGIGIPNPSVFLIDQLVRLKSFPDDTDVYDISQIDPLPHVSKVLYNTGFIGISDNTQTFTTWGTPDGKSVFSSQLRNKQPPVNISRIRGNVIEASTATFVTNTAQPGDTAIIEAANNNIPFNHNGEYVITEVLDNTRVAIRAKGLAEKTFVTTDIPTELNASLPGGTSYGTIRVIVGSYVPATALTFVIPSWIPSATGFYVHVYCGVRIRDLQPGDVGVRFSASDEAILSILRIHITAGTSFRHRALDIDYSGGSAWRDGVTNPAVTVEAQLDKLVTDLTAATGALKIGYNGGPAWADGITNPATSVEQQLDKIVNDLGGAGGASKIKYDGGGNWADGTTNPTTTVEAQLDKIVTDLSASTGAIKIGFNGSGTWADATANPATSIEQQLDKIVSDLAGATGTGKIQGSAVGTDLVVNTLALQLADLATNWLKMSRANTISALQTFGGGLIASGDAGSGNALIVGGQLLAFTDFVYTADSTTNQISKIGHNLQTGDGPVRTSNVGGTLPGGLSPGTDYYVIEFDTNHFLLAISRTDALSGNFIDILTNGSGTNTLLHQSITEREADATITKNLTVKGSITSGINQNITVSGTGDFKHGTRTKIIGFASFPFSPTSTTGNYATNGKTLAANETIQNIASLNLNVGSRILAVRALIGDAIGSAFTLAAFDLSSGGTATLGTSSASAGNATIQTLTVNGLSTVTVTGHCYFIRLIATGTGTVQVLNAEVDYDRP
jgi:hypothetical protein